MSAGLWMPFVLVFGGFLIGIVIGNWIWKDYR